MNVEKTAVTDEIVDKFIDVLNGYYEHARAGIIDMETQNLETTYLGIREIRDAFDHIYLAFCGGNVDDHFNSAEEHLRRAAVESYEYIVEEKLMELLPIFDKPFIYKLAFLKTPLNRTELRKKKEIIKENLREGRRLKANKQTWEEALDKFIEASDVLSEIEKKLPHKHEVYYRLYMIFIPIIMFILGLIVSNI